MTTEMTRTHDPERERREALDRTIIAGARTPLEIELEQPGSEIFAFAGILRRGGFLNDADDVMAYFEKPWKWRDTYRLWLHFGRPEPGTEEFDDWAYAASAGFHWNGESK